MTGTDRTGKWTRVEIEIAYKLNSAAAKVIAEHGPVVASVLHLMSPKSVKHAQSIARLPKDEQKLAIEEWNANSTEVSEHRRKT